MKRKSCNETAELDLFDLLIMSTIVVSSVSVLKQQYESHRAIMNDIDDSISRTNICDFLRFF